MGAGKSTLGRELNRLTGIGFVDLDDLIEQRYGMSIRDMFAQVGEVEFRRREAETLQSTTQMSNVVVALGGGTPCFGDNMDRILASGTTVYLDVPVEKIYHRLMRGRHKRPLISHLSDTELLAYIDENLARRLPYYTRAEATFDAGALDEEIERQATALLFAKQFLK